MMRCCFPVATLVLHWLYQISHMYIAHLVLLGYTGLEITDYYLVQKHYSNMTQVTLWPCHGQTEIMKALQGNEAARLCQLSSMVLQWYNLNARATQGPNLVMRSGIRVKSYLTASYIFITFSETNNKLTSMTVVHLLLAESPQCC